MKEVTIKLSEFETELVLLAVDYFARGRETTPVMDCLLARIEAALKKAKEAA